MKNRILILGLTFLLATSCSTLQPAATIEPAATLEPEANLPNPASTYCVEQGYRFEIRAAADGSQLGVCIFPDGSECDEWAFYRKECFPASQATAMPAQATQAVTPIPPATQILAFESAWVIPQAVTVPAGVLVDPRNGAGDLTRGILFYLPDGLSLGEILAPNGSKFHAAGRYQGSLEIPLVFLSFDLESQANSLSVNHGGTASNPGGAVSNLLTFEDKSMLAGLAGVPGDELLFLTDFQPVEANLRTCFRLGKVDEIAGASPVMVMESSDSRYWQPVAIQVEEGSPSGLWFTRMPWGIGGVCAFEPTEGLYYLRLESNTVHQVISAEHQFASLSPDQTHVAYTRVDDGKPRLFIQDLAGDEPILFSSSSKSERSSGNGMFSPSNRYVAWREAQGCQQETGFQQWIEVASLDGQRMAEFSDSQIFKAAQIENGSFIDLLGWLDEDTILVEVTESTKPHASTLVKINVRSGESSYFAGGFFAGWFYQ